MNDQSPAAGQNYEYAVSIEKIQSRTKKLCLAVVSAALCTLMFWLSMGTADYVRVMKLHERPLFCVASDLNEQGGCFYGFGYSFVIEGDFADGAAESGKIKGATMYIFGMKAGHTSEK